MIPKQRRAGLAGCVFSWGHWMAGLSPSTAKRASLALICGVKGEVNLAHDAATATEWTGGYQVTSAPAIAKDLVITGSSIADNWKVDTGRGIVRAFDARTGQLRWTWDPVPWAEKTQPRTGAGNAWSTLSVDPKEDLVFIPTGSAAPDYYGGIRKGDDKWANSVVALRASSGEFVWGFQVVHHDLWDYDVASQPTLFTWKDGTPAIVINTKMGHVFVLNRLTGAPLLPVEERPVPQSQVEGEQSWPTQPFSTISLVPERISPSDAWGPTAEDVAWCRAKIAGVALGGHVYAPELAGHAGISRQRGRRELGQRGLRSLASRHGREHQSPHCLDQADSARPVRCRAQEAARQPDLRGIRGSERRSLCAVSQLSAFSQIKRLATRRRGARPRQSICLPVRRYGMFRSEP